MSDNNQKESFKVGDIIRWGGDVKHNFPSPPAVILTPPENKGGHVTSYVYDLFAADINLEPLAYWRKIDHG